MPSLHSSAITVNEFFDDLVDRNNDSKIEHEDRPLDWASYKVGDEVIIRDKIDRGYSTSTGKWTVLQLNYTGIYDIRYDTVWGRIDVIIEGNWTHKYYAGDYLTVTATIVTSIHRTGETISEWKGLN